MSEPLPHLEVRLLGEFCVLQEGAEVAGFQSEKARALMALLVLAQGRALEYEQLANDLWAGSEEEQHTPSLDLPDGKRGKGLPRDRSEKAQDSLRQCLQRLQKGRPGKEAPMDLLLDSGRFDKRTGRSSVALALANADIDVLKFEAACAHGSFAEKRIAVAAYQGDLLPDCTLPKIEQHRLRLRLQYQALLDSLIQETKASGNFREALHFYRLRVVSEPHNEALREQWMDLLVRCGEENAAREVYREYVAGLPPRSMPGPALQEKISTLLTSTARPHPTPWNPAEFACLPDPLPPIMGRANALLEIEALLDTSRFVTLKGPPGVGKTLLALHVASRLAPAYNGKVLFVDLTTARNLIDVQRRLNVCFGIVPNPSLSPVENLAQFIDRQRMLVVLDNGEQIVSETGSFLMQLLARAPKLTVLATSQMAWRSLIGEQVYHVRPLSIPPSRLMRFSPSALVEALPKFDAVNLFLTEAVRHQSSVCLTPENARTIAAIVTRLDGLPLAIKLAAGMSPTGTPEEILSHLERDLDILRDGLHAMPEKHRTVHATLRIIYDRLPEDLQTLLRTLAVFRGGWTLESAQELSRQKHIADALVQFQERSLISAEPRDGVLRFSMLETVHRFMIDRLMETPHFETTADRHLQWFSTLASEAEPYLTGPEQGDWVRRLGSETENFRSALEWADASQQIEPGLKLANSLWRVWSTSGLYEAGYNHFETLLAAPNHVDSAVRLKALGACGNLAYQGADYPNARRIFETARDMAIDMNRPLPQASALGNLGNIASLEGNYTEAERLFQSALQIFEREKVERGIAMALGNLAGNACRAKEYTHAIGYSRQTVERIRRLEDPLNLGLALANLADGLLGAGQPAEALTAVTEGLELSIKLSHWRTICQCHAVLLSLAVFQKAWNSSANLIGLRLALQSSRDLPEAPNVEEAFSEHRVEVEDALGKEAFAAAVQQVSSLEPEACLIYLQAHCMHLKDRLSA